MAKLILPPKTNSSVKPKKTPALSRVKSKSVQSAMAKLKSNADRLNSVSNETADLVREVEDFLSITCSIGFDSAIIFEEGANAKKKLLEYRRIGKNYRIAVSIDSLFVSTSMEPKAWSDCSRDLKTESIKHLPALIDAITEKVEEDLANAETAKNAVADVLTSITGNEG